MKWIACRLTIFSSCLFVFGTNVAARDVKIKNAGSSGVMKVIILSRYPAESIEIGIISKGESILYTIPDTVALYNIAGKFENNEEVDVSLDVKKLNFDHMQVEICEKGAVIYPQQGMDAGFAIFHHPKI